MKVLVDRVSSEIRGVYEEPMSFSLSGKYTIDIPDSLSVNVSTVSVSTLVSAKVAAFGAAHPSLIYVESDELLAVTQIDATLSTGIIIGPNKRTMITPGGILYTTVLTGPASNVPMLLHYSGFTLNRYSGLGPDAAPSGLVMNYDSENEIFVPFDNSMITASVTTSGGAFSFTPTPDSEYVDILPASFRLSFTNETETPIYLSDWILLYGDSV